MPGLQFTGDLARAILGGTKTQTLRAKVQPSVKVGARLTMMNGYHACAVFGHAVVTSVYTITCCQLTKAHARLDGFDTLEELHARLKKMKAPRELVVVRWNNFVPVVRSLDANR